MSDKKKLPWMPLDIPAYRADTSTFTTEQHGAYLLLLFGMWMDKGSLPSDDESLASVTGLPLERWQSVKAKILAKFTEQDGRITQKRVTKELVRAQKVSAERSQAGREGAARRWQSDGKSHGKGIAEPMANTMANAQQNDAPPQPHSLPNGKDSLGSSGDAPKEKKPKAVKPVYSPEFEEAWTEYPKRAGGNSKVDAYRAWCARVKAGATPAELLAGTQRYTLYCFAEGKIGTSFVKQAATFYGPGFHFLEAWTPAPKAATHSTRHEARTATMNGLGSKRGPQDETNRTHRTEPIDVQARVVPDAQ